MQFDAFWPPRLAELGLIQRDLGAAGSLRFPRLDTPAIQSLGLELARRTHALRVRPVTGIVDAIAHATQKLVEPGSDLFASALRLIPETTGYSVEMTAHVLRRMAQDWTAAALNRLIEAELGSAQMLDDFAANGPRHTRALGPALTAHVFSGNVPGVAVTSLIRALIVKSPSFGKTAADEPVLPVLFARALAKVDDHLADSLVITHWPGGSRELDAALAGQADTLIVYGGEDAVAAARANTKHTTRLVVHGPKLSFGIVAANASNQWTARNVARAVATFDQQGCVSPHLVYVIGSPEQAAAFAHLVHQQLQEIAAELPRGRLRPDEAIAQHNARASAEFRAISGADLQLLTDPVAGFTVVYDADPMFQLSCLNRFVYIKPLGGIGQLPELLRPVGHHLQSVGVEGFSAKENAELANLLAQLGASRITSFAQLPWLPAEAHHDGNGPLRELLRFVDLET